MEGCRSTTEYNRALLLEAKRIEKSYGGVRALRQVSFGLEAGEVHALVGENGAGKSTLIRVLTGAVASDGGSVLLDGTPITDNSPHRSRELGIAAIYQQPAIFPDLTVAENIALANESGGLFQLVRRGERIRRAKELLESIGAEIDPNREAGTLTMPEQQLVEIAKALGGKVRVLILDEPTASLTERETGRLFEIIRKLRSEGTGIIYISHRLEEVPLIADRITVLRDGETISTSSATEMNTRDLIRLMAGRELSAVFPKREVPIGGVAFEVKGLSSAAAGVDSIDFSIRSGEILGFAGLVGAGRTQLAETIYGLVPVDSGEIRLDDEALSIRNPGDAIRSGIAYVPEDRRSHGVAAELPVRANTTLSILDRISNGPALDENAERLIAGNWISSLQVKTDGMDARAGSLSGGNQQKVAIARALATGPKVLILDEPTQGIDVGAKSECHRIMCDMAAKGVAVMMISSELAEILGISDRVAVMRGGRIAGILDRGQATAESILALALGESHQ